MKKIINTTMLKVATWTLIAAIIASHLVDYWMDKQMSVLGGW